MATLITRKFRFQWPAGTGKTIYAAVYDSTNTALIARATGNTTEFPSGSGIYQTVFTSAWDITWANVDVVLDDGTAFGFIHVDDLPELTEQRHWRIKMGVSGKVCVLSTTGNDSNDGLSIDSGYATVYKASTKAVGGDGIFATGGTYNETNTSAFAANVAFYGSGRGETIIQDTSSTGLQPMLKLANNLRIKSMSVWGSASTSITSFPIGTNFNNATGFVIEDVDGGGFSDFAYIHSTGTTSGVLRHCTGWANEDTCNVTSGGTNGITNLDIIHCNFFLTALAGQTVACRAVDNSAKGLVRVIDSTADCVALATSTGGAVAIQNNASGGANNSGGMHLIDSDFRVRNYGSGNAYSIQSDTTEVRVSNSTFDESQIHLTNGGTVTILGRQADLVDAPNGTAVTAIAGGVLVNTANKVDGSKIDAATSSRAAPGAQMDLVNAPNATAMAAVAGTFWDVLTSATRAAGSFGAWFVGWISGTNTTRAKDSSGNDLATSAALANLQTSVNNQNNLSALANVFGPMQMEIPASGSIVYPFTVLVKDEQGHLVDLSGSPTIAVTNAAGTDRSANLSAVTHASTGVYTSNYTVLSTAVQEGLTFVATGTAAADGLPRRANLTASVVSIDTVTAINAILTQAIKIGTNSGDSPNAVTAQGTIGTNLDAKVSLVPAGVLADTANKLATNADGSVNGPAVDGVSRAIYDAAILALAGGKSTYTDNGDGTYTLDLKKQDGTTTAISVTVNKTTGARTTSTVS